jgi:hypothetical protein
LTKKIDLELDRPNARVDFAAALYPPHRCRFAEAISISPVIPAGRARNETGNYRLIGKYVAGQKVRHFFEAESARHKTI